MSMLPTTIRGLRDRRLLSLGSLLLLSLAIGSAIAGPIFQSAVPQSYLVTQLNEQPASRTGLSFQFTADDPSTPAADATAYAVGAVDDLVGDLPYAPATTELVSQRATVLGGARGQLLSADGMCDHVLLEGECPDGPDELVMQQIDLDTTGTEVGDRVDLGKLGSFTVVGAYQVDETQADYWFNLSRLSSIPLYIDQDTGATTPYQPAPFLVSQDAFTPDVDSFVVVDRRLDVAPDFDRAGLDGLIDLGQQVTSDFSQGVDGGVLTAYSVNDLQSVAADVQLQERAGSASIAPGVISLVLVALALLMRLLMAASELRVPEVALASLRGLSSRDLWLLGLSEPLLLITFAVPLGISTGLLMGYALLRAWLYPGIPLPLPWESVAMALVVVVAAVAVAVLAVALVLRASLASQLTGVRRPTSSGRAAVVTELVLVSLALVVLASKVTGGRGGDPDLTDLGLPVLLAVVAGLLATRAVAAISRWVTRRRSRSLAGFVSARAISRRREGTLVILPITVAIAVVVFGVGVANAASAWRGSVAATVTPADEVWTSGQPFDQQFNTTRRIDPDGQWLMYGATVQGDAVLVSVLDTTRLARVSKWNPLWTPGRSVEQWQDALAPAGDAPPFSGDELTLTLDNELSTTDELWIELELARAQGRDTSTRTYLGPFPEGEATRTVKVDGCRVGCRIDGVNIATRAGLAMPMVGDLTILDLRAGDDDVDVTQAGWGVSPEVPVQQRYGEVSAGDGRVVVRIDTESVAGTVRLVPGEIPELRPVLAGDQGATRLSETQGRDYFKVAGSFVWADPLGETGSTPFLGPSGVLIDYTMLTTDRLLYDAQFTSRVLARGDMPDSVRQDLLAAGFVRTDTYAATKSALDQSAYALALRLYLVVAGLALVMALAGLLVSTAVQLPARRRDAAALRVVGVSRRAVMSAVGREFFLVLGAAAISGIVAGCIAQLVVLRSITLGFSEGVRTPEPVDSLDPRAVTVIALGVALILLVSALATSWATVRGARGATLRETAR